MPSDSTDTAPYRTTAEKDELLGAARDLQERVQDGIGAAADSTQPFHPLRLADDIYDAVGLSRSLSAEPVDAQLQDAALKLLYTAAHSTGIASGTLEDARRKAQDRFLSLAMDMGLEPAVVFLLRVSLERQNTGPKTMTWTQLTDSVARARESSAQVDNLSRELRAANPGSSALPRGTAAARASVTNDARTLAGSTA